MQLRTSQDRCHCNLINKLNCIDLLLVLLQISTRVCVLLDYIVFRSACDYYLEKQGWRRPRRGAGLAAVHHALPPPVGGAHFYILKIHTPPTLGVSLGQPAPRPGLYHPQCTIAEKDARGRDGAPAQKTAMLIREFALFRITSRWLIKRWTLLSTRVPIS